MPNLRQLEYLVAIADTRHFRRAAEKTNATQPTLSEQLKSLEVRLGAKLVERSRSRVVLTPVGQQVVEVARRMLADANEIRSLAASGNTGLSGVMRLGLPPTIGPYLLPHVIPELHATYPGLKLYVREELPNSLPGALEEGRHDMIISLLPVRGAEFVVEPLFREPLYLAVAEDHALAKQDGCRRNDLEGLDVLALGPGHQLHNAVLELCSEFGAKLRYEYEGTSLDTLREMVAMGLGVTFLPGLYVRAVAGIDHSIKAMELTDRSVYRTVGLAWRKSSPGQAHYQELARLLRNIVKREFVGFEVLQKK